MIVLDTLSLSCLTDTQWRQLDAQAWGSGDRSGLEMWIQESLVRDGNSIHESASGKSMGRRGPETERQRLVRVGTHKGDGEDSAEQWGALGGGARVSERA